MHAMETARADMEKQGYARDKGDEEEPCDEWGGVAREDLNHGMFPFSCVWFLKRAVAHFPSRTVSFFHACHYEPRRARAVETLQPVGEGPNPEQN
jgi:hypothetical protein